MHTGGTSGPLFGMWFAQLARAAGAAAEIGLAELAAGAEAGLAGIQRLGGAQPGDKTMVDAMAPGRRGARRGAVAAGASLGDWSRRPPRAPRAPGRRRRADARPARPRELRRRGRARRQDPGALTVALLFEALAEASKSGTSP